MLPALATPTRIAATFALLTTTAAATPQPDFSLPENNQSSERAGQVVSPRDYRGFVSVYYFGHET